MFTFMRFSSSCPCAVPTSCTPRSAMLRQASASASVPISSTMTTSGLHKGPDSTCQEGTRAQPEPTCALYSMWPWHVCPQAGGRAFLYACRSDSAHMWFSTASTMTRCCCDGSGTCMRRAPPMAGCGTSPSPPISLEVSTCMGFRAYQWPALCHLKLQAHMTD
jgi:hypothetical protein